MGKHEESTQTQVTRGWILTAIAAASDEVPDEATFAILLRHLDPAQEPSDWVRFWALAGLHQLKHLELARRAKELLADRKREPRNLVRTTWPSSSWPTWAMATERGSNRSTTSSSAR
ncbi:hypothetical protein [Vitiosangium sp. GDMCC 1.1324]|uniref:hypothetical protein n=1 Tax=Vitiosangium sp. (strain GDMCC 1.1324) TaxID=2138576 RepID=UPI000D340CC6|nr:hypothetical protein [Vitiosangium sp. GDMCC 1.1324]PTL75099.1 hypothetical protein DAT35_56645 [Vitiosangium sp. GDMCC 1.1324]